MTTPQLYARVAQERDELKAQRDHLVAALETLLYVDKQSGIGIYDDRATAHRMARDALARAKGDQS